MIGTLDGSVGGSEPVGYLTAHDLTVDELRGSRLPDTVFTGLKAEIKAEDGRGFDIIYYIPTYYTRPDEYSFVNININPVFEPPYSRSVRAPPRFTQGQIADIIDLLTLLSLTVKIEYLTFGEVPRSAAKQSGLPLEKLTFETKKQ